MDPSYQIVTKMSVVTDLSAHYGTFSPLHLLVLNKYLLNEGSQSFICPVL